MPCVSFEARDQIILPLLYIYLLLIFTYTITTDTSPAQMGCGRT